MTALKSGTLTKRGSKVKSWNRRYFELDDSGNLSYHVSVGKSKKGEMLINASTQLATGSSADLQGISYPYPSTLETRFAIINADRTLYVYSDTVKEAESWVAALTAVIDSSGTTPSPQETPAVRTSSVTAESSMPQESSDKVDKSATVATATVHPASEDSTEARVPQEEPINKVPQANVINDPGASGAEATKPLGVSAVFLRAFVDRLGGLTEKTTTLVCEEFVKPMTKETGGALIQQHITEKDADGKPLVAPATVFVSHAWRYSFKDPLDVMLDHAESHPDAYFWFDLFTNDQNNAAEKPFEWWTTTFRDSIQQIGSVLLVLAPWDDPIPMTRCWCLFEIFSALECGVELLVKLPKAQDSLLFAGLATKFDAIMNALVRVQAEKAEAFNPDDKKNIFKAIEATPGGFIAINQRVKDHLRSYYLNSGIEIAKLIQANSMADTEVYAEFCYNLGCACFSLGKFELSVEFNNIALEYFRAKSDHDKTATALGALGVSLVAMGDLDGSLSTYQECLRLKQQVHGKDHSSTASTLANLAGVLIEMSDYNGALDHLNTALGLAAEDDQETRADIFKSIATAFKALGEFEQSLNFASRALQLCRELRGADHPDVADCYDTMGGVFFTVGEYDQALGAYGEAMRICRATLGDSHLDTAKTLSNVANVFKVQGQYDKALDFYTNSLHVSCAAVGLNHRSVGEAFNNLANVFERLGELELAVEHYQKSIDTLTVALGKDHVAVADPYNNIGIVYQRLGDLEKARSSYEHALRLKVQAFGEEHPAVADTLINLGVYWRLCKDPEKALDYYTKSATIRVAAVGEIDPTVASVYVNMANVYVERQEYDKAMPLYQKALNIKISVFGEEHPSPRDLFQKIGLVYEEMGLLDEALEAHSSCLRIKLSTLGPEHPLTGQSLRDLGLLHRRRGEHEPAAKYLDLAGGILGDAK